MTLAPRWIAPPTVLLAIGLGFFVSRSEWLLPGGILALAALVLATLAPDTLLAAVLVFAALLQPPLGDLGGIPQLELLELVVPILLLVLALRAASRAPASNTLAPTWFAGLNRSGAINLAVAAYALVLAFNYLRSKYLVGSVVPGVNRSFYGYFIALGTYLVVYLLLTARGCNWSKLFRFLFWFSLAVSAVGLVAVVFHLPLSLGNLRYSVVDETSGAVRVGFLETSGTVGLALVLTGKGRARFAAALLFVAALFASGGRAAVIGAAIAVALYLIVTRRPWHVLAAGIIVVLIALAIPSIGSNPQVQRLGQVNQHEFASDGRLYIYSRSLQAFAGDPLFGTGLGVPAYVVSPKPHLSAFYEAQLELGGHATYAALLKDFGLLGFLPFVAAILITLVALAPVTRSNPTAGFFFILLAAEVVDMFVGGNGSDPVCFFALAGGAAVLASRRRDAESIARLRHEGPVPALVAHPSPPALGS